jgi:Gluconate 2-dehydrogenase subunit 3
MDRRESLKALAIGSFSVSTFLAACKDSKTTVKEAKYGAGADVYGRTPEEKERDAKLMGDKFFTNAEMKTITVLTALIIPADEHSGSAVDAGVPDFIEFMVKDQPRYQVPMRGGLRWLDVFCLKHHKKIFVECNAQQQTSVLDIIAYPEKATPETSQGVMFFSALRNLTASGFFTSKMGIKDLGYVGNTPNEWNGVPDDVLKQYGLAYDEKLLPLYLKMEDRGKLMTWD